MVDELEVGIIGVFKYLPDPELAVPFVDRLEDCSARVPPVDEILQSLCLQMES